MSWLSLRLALLLPLAGCGFHPLYAERGPAGFDPVLASIDVRTASDRLGQIMTKTVRDELNPEGAAVDKRYVLKLGATEQRTDLGIRRDNTSTRGELVITANLALSRSGAEQPLFSDSIRSQTAFNISDDAYAASVAEENARREAALALGREIALRVELYFRQEAEGKAP